MTEPLRLLPPRVAFIDPAAPGFMSRDWYLFFQQLYIRVGGSSAPTNNDIAGDLFEDAGSSEVTAQLFGLSDETRQQPLFEPLPFPDDQTPPAVCCPLPDDPRAELSALRDQVAELSKELDGARSDISQLQSQLAEVFKAIDAINQSSNQL